ncbi:uncharacterized protein PODANS_1_11800 [Podospora anserina S mat+]|uniref:Podospora anserina S mat+ genomic DNA chromosome 1, supercontig 2 n=1 Tax=Podospora anserina (strain S / ATCC MYA-4624 / DSM 980 / FGSC 10383) TaxID=515849 RepID=B2AYP6_PODAN|nr:uncharacterized protein PODANS_1_11800 [Podospora anserina S mat+]CAP69520.1 unnamed protein product [Podospora anserina S mat+]CDP23537.1 Putative protein of unknown function [Podospora anserina S mat+]
MAPTPAYFQALLRPAVLQILRATGYHAMKPSVLDFVTQLAAAYLDRLCFLTAKHATLNSHALDGFTDEDEILFELNNGTFIAPDGPFLNPYSDYVPPPGVTSPSVATPSVVDVRMALQEVGALLPEKSQQEQDYLGIEDMRGVEAFIAWAMGPINKEIQRIALDGNDEAKDYLDGADDTKFLGTLLGRPIEQGEVAIEGGGPTSIREWEEIRKKAAERPTPPPLENHNLVNGDGEDSRPGSSGLSSLADEDVDMDLDIGIGMGGVENGVEMDDLGA